MNRQYRHTLTHMLSDSGAAESFANDLIETGEKSVFAEEADHFFEILSVEA